MTDTVLVTGASGFVGASVARAALARGFRTRVLMRPAADAMAEALDRVEMKPPVVPVVSNVLARPISDPAEIRRRLVEQVTGIVRWTESVAWLAGEGGVTQFLELGAGKVLSGLAKRIAPDATGVSIGAPAELEAFVASLG